MECAAEAISGGPRASRPLRQYVDDRQIRSTQSDIAQAPAGRRHQAARILAGDHGGLFQIRERTPRRNFGDNPNFKKTYDSLNNFTNNAYQWFQVAELGYD